MKPRAKRTVLIGGGVILALAILVANLVRQAGGGTPVQVADAKVGDLSSTVRAPGKVEPVTMVKLSANVPGEVTRLDVKAGDHVHRGQFLLQLDDTQYKAQVLQSRAALAAARSSLKSSEATFTQSDAVLKRKESLFEQKLVSPEELDSARTQRDSDKARLDADREDVTRLDAAYTAAQDNLSKTRFESPIDGTVTQLNIERGEIVVIGTMNNPGTVILTVADLSHMKVEADVDETDVSSVRLGQHATVKVDALPDTSLAGAVSEIANSPKVSDLGTQGQQTDFEVDVMLDHPPPSLRPGMTADVEIRTGTRKGVLHVPLQAVVVRTQEELDRAMRRSKGHKEKESANSASSDSLAKKKSEELKGVFVMEKGVAKFRKVRTGIASDTDIEVTGDVKAGEKVITGPYRALRNLKPEQKVKVEKPKDKGTRK